MPYKLPEDKPILKHISGNGRTFNYNRASLNTPNSSDEVQICGRFT
ncbi:MAG: hypothetical protein ACI4JD_02285 [Ruminococcus sp.]